MTTAEKIKEKPRGWANLQKQLEEVRNESFKQGFWAGENSKHKSDLQQELSFLEKLGGGLIIENHPERYVCLDELRKKINLIKKELEENGK